MNKKFEHVDLSLLGVIESSAESSFALSLPPQSKI